MLGGVAEFEILLNICDVFSEGVESVHLIILPLLVASCYRRPADLPAVRIPNGNWVARRLPVRNVNPMPDGFLRSASSRVFREPYASVP